MRDITLEDTFYMDFTTRAFATGIPTVLAGSPVLSVLEENNATPITAGVSVSVDRASVVGLNMATIVATAANGYEAGKGYSVYISTGTVDSVSAVGEVVGSFTIGASAAAVDLANGTDGLGAIKTDTAAVLVDTADMQPKLGTPAADLSADVAAVKVDTAAVLVDTAEIGAAGAGLTDLGGMSTGMKAEVEAEVDDALTGGSGTIVAPTALPVLGTDGFATVFAWLAAFADGLHAMTQDGSTKEYRNAADAANLATSSVTVAAGKLSHGAPS